MTSSSSHSASDGTSRGDYDPSNVFACIIGGDLPCYKVLETAHCLAFLDINPVAHGHTLLIPKFHTASESAAVIMDITDEQCMLWMKELPRVARAVQKVTKAEGITILQNNLAVGGQEVFHPHVHIIPRFANDKLIRIQRNHKNADAAAAETKQLAPEDGVNTAALIADALKASDESHL